MALNEKGLALNEKGLALYREVSDVLGVVAALTNIGLVKLAQGVHVRSATLLREDLRLAWELDHKVLHPVQHDRVGKRGASQVRPIRAARLWEAAEGMSETYGTHLALAVRTLIDYEGRLTAARSRLDDVAWSAVWDEGRAMSPEQAIEYALEQEVAPEPAASETFPAGLSVREAEVLRLVAAGMTDAEVARKLFISRRTVN